MAEVTLDKLRYFHRQLELLDGLQLLPGSLQNRDELEQVSIRIDSLLRTGYDWQAIAKQESKLPSSYWAALRIWLETGDLAAALNELTLEPELQQYGRVTRRLSMLLPVVMTVLAAAAVGTSFYYAIPKYLAIYDQLQRPPGRGLALLVQLRGSVWWWASPLGLLGVVVLVVGLSARRVKPLPLSLGSVTEAMPVGVNGDATLRWTALQREFLHWNAWRQFQLERRGRPRALICWYGGFLVLLTGSLTFWPFVEVLLEIGSMSRDWR